MAITLTYQTAGVQHSDEFPTLIVHGMDEPDHLRKLCLVQEYRDGRLKEFVRGFNKIITLRFQAGVTAKQRRFLANWFVAETKALLYENADGDTFISEGFCTDDLIDVWLEDCELDRIFEVTFADRRNYNTWQEPEPPPVDDEDTMYMKLSVEMDDTKTEADPEEFTTNSGKLLLDEWGDSFPTFNDATHKFFVVMKSADGSSADYPIANIHVTAGALIFETFPASGFVPAPDGKLYANFAVWLQKKPT